MKKEPAVLLVEDEPLLGELMTEALIDQGYEVHAAPDAKHALRYLLSGADVDVLFTDIDLGTGMDGAALAKLAREMRPKLPVVYTSGRRSMNDIPAVPDAAFLPKPFSLEALRTTLAQIVRQQPVPA
jgi:two-component system, response regulator PdtaR